MPDTYLITKKTDLIDWFETHNHEGTGVFVVKYVCYVDGKHCFEFPNGDAYSLTNYPGFKEKLVMGQWHVITRNITERHTEIIPIPKEVKHVWTNRND